MSVKVPENAKAGDEVGRCWQCNGRGKVRVLEKDGIKYSMALVVDCSACSGAGLVKMEKGGEDG